MTNLCLLAGGIAGWWASIEDAMAEATVNTIIGITVVFAALLLFVFVISFNSSGVPITITYPFFLKISFCSLLILSSKFNK